MGAGGVGNKEGEENWKKKMQQKHTESGGEAERGCGERSDGAYFVALLAHHVSSRNAKLS